MRTKFYFVILVLGLFISESSSATFIAKHLPTPGIPQVVSGLKIVTGHPDLKMKVSRCEVSGTTCVVDMLVTNYAADAVIHFYGGGKGTKVYDDEGNVYTDLDVRIQPAGTNDSYGYKSENSIVYPTELPIKLRLIIKGLANAAKELKRISLTTESTMHSIALNQPIMLYNIPISREGDE